MLKIVLSFAIELIFSLLLILFVLLSIAYTTLAERKVMGAIQRRMGPNVVGFGGMLQPIADGLKLLLKEVILPRNANVILFLFAPVLVLILSLYIWIFLPLTISVHSDLFFGLLYILVVGVLEIYGIMLAGWSSNSKYALIGGLRSTAQMISYEISLSFVFLGVIFLTGSFNLVDFVVYQQQAELWLILPLFPFCIIFLVSMLAETNRAPFDLPEAEAEIVAGYNVEYSGFLFALFFLGEYSNMVFLSGVFSLLFLSGGTGLEFESLIYEDLFYSDVVTIELTENIVLLQSLVFSFKICCILFFFIWIRATLPRYRYDQLMDLGWKVFLPITFGYLTCLISYLYYYNLFPVVLLF